MGHDRNNRINWYIIKLKIDQYSKETAKVIFDEIDKENKGIIEAEKFLEYITRSNEKSNFNKFYQRVINELISPLERIIVKLKKLKRKVVDDESLDDIDW